MIRGSYRNAPTIPSTPHPNDPDTAPDTDHCLLNCGSYRNQQG
jgi:hypothetical protein